MPPPTRGARGAAACARTSQRPSLLVMIAPLAILCCWARTAAAAPTPAAPAPAPSLLPAEAYLNADGLPLLTPLNRSTDGRGWYYEVPRNPVGTLVMLHRCGRNAEDSWPPSSSCPQCIGMPEGVSISKQALARGYALLAINSADRGVGPGTRCWSWGTDAVAVRDIVTAFLREKRLTLKPLFFTGCSSGGSLALRLPRLLRIDGIMPVAIGLEQSAFPLADPEELEHRYPPVAFVHFVKDANTDGKIKGMLEVMRERGVPAGEARVEPFPVTPDFFARRDDMVSLGLSQALHAAFKQAGILDSDDYIAGWDVEGQPPPWDSILLEELGRMLEAAQGQQLVLKNNTLLALVQQALDAAGEQLLSIQEVSADADGAADAEASAEDDNPNFSDSDGLSSASAGADPFLSSKLLDQHIKEEIAVAWATHTNLGDYTTAALVFLEHCGRVSFDRLAARHAVAVPAALSPVRAVPAARVAAAWRACSKLR